MYKFTLQISKKTRFRSCSGVRTILKVMKKNVRGAWYNYIHKYIYVDTYMKMHMHMYINMYIYVHTYMYVYIYIYT